MILRPSYIEAIAPFIDQPLVKILAGVRRCGKSTIFEMLADELRRRGVPEDRIIKKRYTEMDIPADISARLTLIAFGAESDVNYKKGIVCMLTVKSLNKSYRVGKATCKVLKGDFL